MESKVYLGVTISKNLIGGVVNAKLGNESGSDKK